VINDIIDAFSPLGQYAVDWGLRVARCESNYNPDAVNGWSGTEGLFQFMPSTWRGTPYGRYNVFDPKYNALAAAWVYSRQGGGPWQCS
jgi:soluble lytic murein transglycosylase-like protein